MNNIPEELSQEKVKKLVETIAAPTFKFLLKRIDNYIISNENNSDISLNAFMNVVLIAMASLDVNILHWLEKVSEAKTGEKINSNNLRSALIANINEQLGIKIH